MDELMCLGDLIIQELSPKRCSGYISPPWNAVGFCHMFGPSLLLPQPGWAEKVTALQTIFKSVLQVELWHRSGEALGPVGNNTTVFHFLYFFNSLSPFSAFNQLRLTSLVKMHHNLPRASAAVEDLFAKLMEVGRTDNAVIFEDNYQVSV